MTALGATVYGGFFLLAALWLVVTGDHDTADDGIEPDQQDRPTPAPVSAPVGG